MWSLMKRLIWLHVISGGGGGAVTTVTGTSPLTLANALAKSIRSLIQYGKVTTSDGDMYCNNGKLVAVDDELSVVGTPEVLTIGEQAATVENLLAVDDIKDEQNIISGAVTRRCEAVISDGTTPSGRYIGDVGEGNIIVKVRETGYEGDVATFEADRAKPLNGLTVNVEPIQDLNGYGNPWPAGSGVNLLPNAGTFDATRNGIRFVSDGKGTYTITGTATADASYEFPITEINIPSTVYIHMLNTVSTYSIALAFFNGNTQVTAPTPVPVNAVKDVSASLGGKTVNKLRLFVANGYTANITFSPMLCIDNTVKPFAPYSNICPISGRTSATIYRSGADTSNPTTYTITLGDTVYGGKLDVTQGKMMVDRAYKLLNDANKWQTFTGTVKYRYNEEISRKLYDDSYTGLTCSIAPTITGAYYTARWIAANNYYFGIADKESTPVTSLDAIKAMATAGQIAICYSIEPIEITLTPTQIETLIGMNNIWSDAGAVKAYVADAELIEHVTAQPLRTAEGNNTVAVTSAVDPVQLSATYTASE